MTVLGEEAAVEETVDVVINVIVGRGAMAVGHCTVECHCCEQARVFELDAKHKLRIQDTPTFDQNYKKNSVYANRMIQIATLGLKVGNFDNPVDLISSNIAGTAMPPQYSLPLHIRPYKGTVGETFGRDRETLISNSVVRYEFE